MVFCKTFYYQEMGRIYPPNAQNSECQIFDFLTFSAKRSKFLERTLDRKKVRIHPWDRTLDWLKFEGLSHSHGPHVLNKYLGRLDSLGKIDMINKLFIQYMPAHHIGRFLQWWLAFKQHKWQNQQKTYANKLIPDTTFNHFAVNLPVHK